MEEQIVFEAQFTETGEIMQWYAPQTWRNVFKNFKLQGQESGHGLLYCNGKLIRKTGKERGIKMNEIKNEAQEYAQRIANRLNRLFNNYANNHTEDDDETLFDFLDDALEENYITDANHVVRGILLYITLGGPTCWIDTLRQKVICTWGLDEGEVSLYHEVCEMILNYMLGGSY